jgi:hypothetical protein
MVAEPRFAHHLQRLIALANPLVTQSFSLADVLACPRGNPNLPTYKAQNTL